MSALLPHWFVVHINAKEVALMSVFLRSLSDKDILSRTLELTRRERSVTLSVLLNLNEVERRQLHLKEGFSSMFAYCTSGLRYSESAANLRIRAARCLARFPDVFALLEANEVNPSTLSQVSKILTPENRNDVLSRVRNKSQREVEAIVAEYDARAALPGDRLRTVVVRVPMGTAAARTVADSPVTTKPSPESDDKWQENHRCNSGELPDIPAERPACPGEAGGDPARPLLETRKEFRFTASEAFKQKFDLVMSLAAHRLSPNPSFEPVFELAMDSFLEKHDPSARRERREQRNQKTKARQRGADKPPVPQQRRTNENAPEAARHIPTHVRDQVFLRDKGRCSYIGPGGRRCGSRYVLQIDHIQPVARGGASTADNLRLLCAYHNR
ncbi:MAG TPA: HNH endonuclease signature motif containing protein, partial [Candidatus Krumholzibacteria bacterium]|nr:HNH endonuclease signature motif containing protein [Candidatus Krumholzibacteria bacterium]